jgi:uncharacterized membrane protein
MGPLHGPNVSRASHRGRAVSLDVRPPRATIVAALVFLVVYLVLDFNKLWALRYGADTGTFVQFLSGFARGAGSWNGAEGRPHLLVHDTWVLLALVPLMALFPYAQTLLIVQVLAVAAAGPAIAAFARACGAGRGASAAVGIAYLLSPSAQGLAYGNFLENVFVPVLAALGALAVRLRAFWLALLTAQTLLGLKEDQALFLMWFGTACALWWDRRLGISIAVLAAINGIAFVLVERAAHAVPSIPSYALQIDAPLEKLAFFIALLAPFAFAPLWLGSRLLLAVPLVAEVVLNRPWAYVLTRIGTHWTAPLVIATALASAYVIARRPQLARPMLACALVCALVFNDTVLKAGRWPFVVNRSAYDAARSLRSATAVVVIPRSQEGAYVVAAPNPQVRLAPFVPGEPGYCPAYNHDARAFFASIGLGTWPDVHLCGGTAIGRKP